ncbi:hypothetical protein HMPREF0973_00103 [Prevotella veroralis F0319]|uniref:Uncharacterized protein n=1 Tax=Prevotella veroralis F0319 TaxID=649761 RepID=C9MKJ5_9BACT|nr:hypothetical protein HMPREF0973_00103 [Prevotella veroralis F0319]
MQTFVFTFSSPLATVSQAFSFTFSNPLATISQTFVFTLANRSPPLLGRSVGALFYLLLLLLILLLSGKKKLKPLCIFIHRYCSRFTHPEQRLGFQFQTISIIKCAHFSKRRPIITDNSNKYASSG